MHFLAKSDHLENSKILVANISSETRTASLSSLADTKRSQSPTSTVFIFTIPTMLWFKICQISGASESLFGLGATTAILGAQQLGLAPSFWHWQLIWVPTMVIVGVSRSLFGPSLENLNSTHPRAYSSKTLDKSETSEKKILSPVRPHPACHNWHHSAGLRSDPSSAMENQLWASDLLTRRI